MYKTLSVLIVICARGGSKGIPNKNIRLLAGKPLLAHSIETGLKSGFADRVIVSTDDEEIKRIAIEYGADAPFIRPSEFANDTIGRIAAVIHAVREAEKYYQQYFDIIIDLGNGSPLRNQQDLEGTVKKLVENPDTDVVYTVTEAARNPYYNMVEVNTAGLAKLSKTVRPQPSCRQDAPPVYELNDSIYAIRRDSLMANQNLTTPIQLSESLKQRVFIMPPERSIDIDRKLDFQLAEKILQI